MPKLWNVETASSPPIFAPTIRTTRSRISAAALLVKVIARIERASTPRSRSRAMRVVTTRVLPDPAPAKTSMGPRSCSTAFCCAALSDSIRTRGFRTLPEN